MLLLPPCAHVERKVTDIVILVVAADDGIMPQTVEAINHAKGLLKSLSLFAINKIDKPEADIKRVKDALLGHELIPEDLGGDIMVSEISAKEKINLDGLIDTVLLQSEVLEPKSQPQTKRKGRCH